MFGIGIQLNDMVNKPNQDNKVLYLLHKSFPRTKPESHFAVIFRRGKTKLFCHGDVKLCAGLVNIECCLGVCERNFLATNLGILKHLLLYDREITEYLSMRALPTTSPNVSQSVSQR
jgi:hypothetical protein